MRKWLYGGAVLSGILLFGAVPAHADEGAASPAGAVSRPAGLLPGDGDNGGAVGGLLPGNGANGGAVGGLLPGADDNGGTGTGGVTGLLGGTGGTDLAGLGNMKTGNNGVGVAGLSPASEKKQAERAADHERPVAGDDDASRRPAADVLGPLQQQGDGDSSDLVGQLPLVGGLLGGAGRQAPIESRALSTMPLLGGLAGKLPVTSDARTLRARDAAATGMPAGGSPVGTAPGSERAAAPGATDRVHQRTFSAGGRPVAGEDSDFR